MRWIVLIIAIVLLPRPVATDTLDTADERQQTADESFEPSEKVRAGDSIPFPSDI